MGACPLGRRFALAAMVPGGGACRLCRLPILPLTYFLAPIPPPPFPAGRGRFLVFLCKGLRPLHPRSWTGRGTGSVSVGGARRGACPLGRRFALPPRYPVGGACPLGRLPILPLACFSAPIPLTLLPLRGRGRFLVFLCKGLRPLHPRNWTGRGTGSTSVSGTRRGACPLGHRFALAAMVPGGGQIRQAPEKMQAHKNSARRAY